MAPHCGARRAGWVRAGLYCLLLSVGWPADSAPRNVEGFLRAKLTPSKFAACFEHFDYELSALVKPADVFLRDRSGDCDDYAIFSDYILSRTGYKTRIVRVVLVGSNIGHAICYVNDKKAYLDFNNRKFLFNLQRSGESLREIAEKVAESFEQNWTSATEYTYSYSEDVKRMKMTVVKTDPPQRDPDRRR